MPPLYTHDPDYVFQFTEEKLGQAEKTELDPHLENLITRADGTKNWTEKILRQTEVLLQPNPSKRKNKDVKRHVTSQLKVTSANSQSNARWSARRNE